MQDLKFHELADIFPLLIGEPLQELATDIKANGLHEPITVLGGQILDGRNRYNAAKLAGFNLTSESFEHFNGDDPVAFVISKNIHRRHLTNDQRAQIAAELYSKLPRQTQGGDRKSKSHVCDNDKQPPSADSQKEKVAKHMRVSVRGMERAAAIQNKDPEKAAEVKAGTKTIKEVEKELKPKKLATLRRGRVTPQLDKAREIIRESIESAKPVSPHKLEQQHGISHVTFDMAITAELARKQALSERPEITPEITDQQKLELAIKQQKEKLNREFYAAVNLRVEEFLENTIGPILRKQQAEARQIMDARKGVMTRKDYIKIRACLHPDSILDPEQKPKYEAAFKLFEGIEKLLLNEKESPTHFVPAPVTPADWAALRKQETERKKAARRASKGGTNITGRQ